MRCGRGRGLPGPWLPWHCPGKFGRGKPLPYAHQSKKCGNFQGLFVSSPSRTALTRHPVPRGGFHKAGEGPAFGGSLVTFCPPRKSPQLQRVSPRQGNEVKPEKLEKAPYKEGCVAKRKFCGTSFFTLNSKNESSMWNFRSVLGMQKPAHTTWMELSAEVFQFR